MKINSQGGEWLCGHSCGMHALHAKCLPQIFTLTAEMQRNLQEIASRGKAAPEPHFPEFWSPTKTATAAAQFWLSKNWLVDICLWQAACYDGDGSNENFIAFFTPFTPPSQQHFLPLMSGSKAEITKVIKINCGQMPSLHIHIWIHSFMHMFLTASRPLTSQVNKHASAADKCLWKWV